MIVIQQLQKWRSTHHYLPQLRRRRTGEGRGLSEQPRQSNEILNIRAHGFANMVLMVANLLLTYG